MSVQEATAVAPSFSHARYTVRRKVLTFLGAKFHVYDPAGNVVLFAKLKAFKLKEDVRLFTGEDMQTELLSIRARQILDFSSAYDVVDSASGTKLGVLKRRGLKSLLRDEWIIMDAQDRDIGTIQEDSAGLAIIRRVIGLASLLIPQKFDITIGGRPAATFQQNFNPFVQKLALDFSPSTPETFDRRLGIAASVIILAVESRQG